MHLCTIPFHIQFTMTGQIRLNSVCSKRNAYLDFCWLYHHWRQDRKPKRPLQEWIPAYFQEEMYTLTLAAIASFLICRILDAKVHAWVARRELALPLGRCHDATWH